MDVNCLLKCNTPTNWNRSLNCPACSVGPVWLSVCLSACLVWLVLSCLSWWSSWWSWWSWRSSTLNPKLISVWSVRVRFGEPKSWEDVWFKHLLNFWVERPFSGGVHFKTHKLRGVCFYPLGWETFFLTPVSTWLWGLGQAKKSQAATSQEKPGRRGWEVIFP